MSPVAPGVPPLSPLLSNLYMRRFVLGWKALGHAKRLRARIVNYADDLVICCRGSAEEALRAMRAIMERLKLTVNESKTRLCRLPDDSFDFLGACLYPPFPASCPSSIAREGFPGKSRNEPCLCGSKRKYKKCCLLKPRRKVHYQFTFMVPPPTSLPTYLDDGDLVPLR